MRMMHCCRTCGSTDVWSDAFAALNTDEVQRYDDTHCMTCERQCKTEEIVYVTMQVIVSEKEDDVFWVNVAVDRESAFAAEFNAHRIIDGDKDVDFTMPQDREALIAAINRMKESQ